MVSCETIQLRYGAFNTVFGACRGRQLLHVSGKVEICGAIKLAIKLAYDSAGPNRNGDILKSNERYRTAMFRILDRCS